MPETQDHTQATRWQDALQIGDIVLFAPVPSPDTPAPGSRPRPYLVCDLVAAEGGTLALLFAASDETPPVPRPRPEGPAQADDLDRYGADSLPGFFARDPIRVSLDHRGFVLDAATGAPTVGRLTERALEKVFAIRRVLRAFARIKARGVPGTWELPFPDLHSDRVGTIRLTYQPLPATGRTTIH